MNHVDPVKKSPAQSLSAWSIHLLTASGAVWGFLALLASHEQRWLLAFVWMAVAVAVDSVDGLLARRLGIQTALPNFDGALLDNVVDYFTYVVVPAYLLYQAQLLPAPLAMAGVAMVLLTSAYQFCQVDAKTPDHYFKGFPSYWNIVVFYLFILELGQWFNFVIIAALAVLVFVPIKYIYPSRTEAHRRLTLALIAVWGVANLAILFQFPSPDRRLIWASLLCAGYYSLISLYVTIAPRVWARVSAG
jgi:phosphatidylcholine synthase